MNIREAKPGDETAIHTLIKELADYEREPDAVINTPENLYIDLFVDQICDALVVENEKQEIVGFALYYQSYSTWKGRCLYLEDFYLKPSARRGGIGSKLFQQVVDIAKARNVKRMDWQVLAWNEPAIQFYKKHQAILDDEWMNGRLFF
ncbi:MAG TPA: GNAT family N-acetyltransferase [Fluviicola sp.]|nr:GNAT family N-acetyltransferase [Fluviicola sp.]